jgi:predicted N-formylglutamate amidohydrolase
MKFVISCEHGGNRIPLAYRSLFKRHRAALESHRGYDPGALAQGRDFAKALDAELVYSTTSRLLVELNRSPRHPQVFSEITRPLADEEREALLQNYYRPYRTWLETQVREAVTRGERVLHVSSHSFTPRLNGVTRNADVGLLYDPRREPELRICLAWKRELEEACSGIVVRRNYPYRGTGDGMTTYLRTLFPAARYAGIEIEVNQKFTLADKNAWHELRKTLVSTLKRAIARTF